MPSENKGGTKMTDRQKAIKAILGSMIETIDGIGTYSDFFQTTCTPEQAESTLKTEADFLAKLIAMSEEEYDKANTNQVDENAQGKGW